MAGEPERHAHRGNPEAALGAEQLERDLELGAILGCPGGQLLDRGPGLLLGLTGDVRIVIAYGVVLVVASFLAVLARPAHPETVSDSDGEEGAG